MAKNRDTAISLAAKGLSYACAIVASYGEIRRQMAEMDVFDGTGVRGGRWKWTVWGHEPTKRA